MTTTTLPTAPEAAPAATPSGAGKDASAIRLSAAGHIRTEWIKLRSVRSTVWSYALLVVFSLGLAAIMSASLDLQGADVSMVPAANQATFVAQASTFGVFFGQLIVAVLGVLTISGEYSTGMIRSTLAAVPNRLPALWAKSAVLFTTTVLVGLVSTVGSYLVSNAGINMFGLMSFSQVPIEWWVDLLVVLGWLAAGLAGAAVLLKRRDA